MPQALPVTITLMIIALTLFIGDAVMIPLKHLIGRQWGAGDISLNTSDQAEFDLAKALIIKACER